MEHSIRLPEISFFCPAYNEQENLPEFIRGVYRFLSEVSEKFEIIIVNDGSRDRTGAIADEIAAAYPEVRAVHHRRNLGYGMALRSGFSASRFAVVMYVDSDNQYDVRESLPALERLEEYDVVSFFARKKAVTFRRKIQSSVYNALVRLLFGLPVRDVNCSLKIYTRRALDAIAITSTSAFIDAEMLIKARRFGFRTLQLPVTHYERTKGKATGAKPDVILATIRDMVKFRLGML